MNYVGDKIWFTVGKSAIAKRGEVKGFIGQQLVRMKVYHENGKSSLVTYVMHRIESVEVW